MPIPHASEVRPLFKKAKEGDPLEQLLEKIVWQWQKEALTSLDEVTVNLDDPSDAELLDRSLLQALSVMHFSGWVIVFIAGSDEHPLPRVLIKKR